jgi:hypothetical protein
MSGLLAATQPARTIVVEHGGGVSWWTFATALVIAFVAAAASYYATWRFKKGDVTRDNAFRAADVVQEASQITSNPTGYEEAGGASGASRLLWEARVRAEPVGDFELDDRFRAAQAFALDMELAEEEPGRARHWLYLAIWNVRAALVPHLKAPRLVGRRLPMERSFPTFAELNAMPSDPSGRDGNVRIDALVEWRAEHAEDALPG